MYTFGLRRHVVVRWAHTNVSGGKQCFHFNLKGGGVRFLRNLVTHLLRGL
jgi:hypothetical protein